MIQRLGRFEIERSESGVVVRALPQTNYALVAHIFLLGALTVLALLASPFAVSDGDAVAATSVIMLFIALSLVSCPTTRRLGVDAAARRSTYPRLRRQLEARWSRGAYRTQDELTLTIDGKSFSGKDFVGVVVAWWVEVRSAYIGNVTQTRYFAPTLVFRDRAYELAVYEGGDETEAQELADRVASMVAGVAVKACRVRCPKKEPFTLILHLAHFLVVLAAIGLAIAALVHARQASHHAMAYAWSAFGATVAASALFLLLIARFGQPERSARGRMVRETATFILVSGTQRPAWMTEEEAEVLSALYKPEAS